MSAASDRSLFINSAKFYDHSSKWSKGVDSLKRIFQSTHVLIRGHWFFKNVNNILSSKYVVLRQGRTSSPSKTITLCWKLIKNHTQQKNIFTRSRTLFNIQFNTQKYVVILWFPDTDTSVILFFPLFFFLSTATKKSRSTPGGQFLI